MKKKIALIYGGAGAEHAVSLMGHEHIWRKLNREKYEPYNIFINGSGAWYIQDNERETETFPVRLGGRSGFISDGKILDCDCAFPLLHGDMGEDGCVQGALECAGIPYVGENVQTGSLCIDKSYTKAVAERLGIPTARWLSFRGRTDIALAERMCSSYLGYPMFIKPTRLGSSVGASAVFRPSDFTNAFLNAMEQDGSVIVEELVIDKRELELAYLCRFGERIITAPAEVVCHGTYGYAEKYSGVTETLTVADLPSDINNTLHEYSEKLITELDLRSISRIDFFLSQGKIFFNEINTMPGFTEESLYLKMLEGYGISASEVIDTLIENAEGRQP